MGRGRDCGESAAPRSDMTNLSGDGDKPRILKIFRNVQGLACRERDLLQRSPYFRMDVYQNSCETAYGLQQEPVSSIQTLQNERTNSAGRPRQGTRISAPVHPEYLSLVGGWRLGMASGLLGCEVGVSPQYFLHN